MHAIHISAKRDLLEFAANGTLPAYKILNTGINKKVVHATTPPPISQLTGLTLIFHVVEITSSPPIYANETEMISNLHMVSVSSSKSLQCPHCSSCNSKVAVTSP
jgi:hypothetical protein